jgi:mono/diheme cytochrome c family protein
VRIGFLLMLSFLLMLCASFARAQSEWKAPADAAAKKNPLKDKPELTAGGKKVFVKTCAICHESGSKAQKGPELSSPAVQKETDGALFWKISNGNSRTGMPSFSSLPDAQRWQLVLYIRSLGTAKPL